MSMSSDPDMNKVLKKTFWRTFTMGASWEYTRQMATGYCYAMVPSIKKIYKNDRSQMELALQRHMQFFNITNVFAPLVLGTSIAMEQKNANSKNFSTELINNIKISLMGPLSAIGDSLFLSTYRIICTGLAISLCKAGNVLGPIIFLLAYNVPATILRYFGLKIGYNQGTNFLEKISDSNIIQRISEKASILGMFVIGSMIPSLVVVKTPIKIGNGSSAQSLTSILNSIMPDLLPFVITMIILWMLNKKIKVGWILIIIVIFSILGTGLKFLSV